MFGKKKKNTIKDSTANINVKFVIPQISESYEGLKKTKTHFEKSEFASSLYGSGIRDVSTYHDNSHEVDIRKTYDAYRSKEDKKISDQDMLRKYGTKYPEFQQMNLNTAKEIYGTPITINKKNVIEEKKNPVKFDFIKQKEDLTPAPYAEVSDVEDNNIIEDVKNDDKPAESAFVFNLPTEEKISSFKPSIEIVDDEEEDFIPKVEAKPHTNIIRRTQEEMNNVFEQAGQGYRDALAKEEMERAQKEALELEHRAQRPFNNIDTSEDVAPKNSISFEPSFNTPKIEINIEEERQKFEEAQQFMDKYSNYIYPPIDKFKRTTEQELSMPEWVFEMKENINAALASFDIAGEVVNITKGPTFTRYEVLLQSGVNVKKISNLQDTIQANLGVTSIRIQAPIPGKRTVGIEVPNDKTQTVWFGDIITDSFVRDGNPLNIALGKDIDGVTVTSDISKWPHGLIGGSTGSGKSVCINTLLISLLLKNKPDELKLILIDPKQVELITYNDLPHLITPVISDPKMASAALQWSVEEMERRYSAFASYRSKGIKDYNEKCSQDVSMKKLPYIVIVIDELADLMQVCSSDVEASIQRLTQKARAAGIHLICATQRPTVDVVKGTIKTNIPARIAFKVSSQTDSITILNEVGAESLLGKGDMLIIDNDKARRLQGAYIPDSEIDMITDYIRAEAEPDYVFDHSVLQSKFEQDSLGTIRNDSESNDMLFECAKFFIESETCSINFLQQQFQLGFNRASRIVSKLEELGVISGKQGTKSREILMTYSQLCELFERDMDNE